MNDIIFLQGKKIAVLGLGIEGIALADFLVSTNVKLTILDKFSEFELLKNGTDSKKINEIIENEKIEKILGEHYLDNLERFDIIFRSPGLTYLNPQLQEAKSKGVIISSQIKLFFDLCPCQIVGVTGTKGKGTTSSLLFEILEKNPKQKVYLAGNIGYSAITLIPELTKYDIVILELSSFQLMDLEKSPHIAIVTNLTVDHLDYHKDVEEYRESKINILKYQTESDFAVLNLDSTFEEGELKKIKSTKLFFSSKNKNVDAWVEEEKDETSVVLRINNQEADICKESEIKLFGHHNLENIAAASIAASILNVPFNTISHIVKDFKGLPHRIEFVREINGVKYINDSFATNPDPTTAAIYSFSEPKILILGGSSKGADFSELAGEIKKNAVTGVVLIGDEAEKIESALKEKKFSGKVVFGGKKMKDIVKKTREIANQGEVVILSPACASFGLFKNYKDRGDQFRKEILSQ